MGALVVYICLTYLAHTTKSVTTNMGLTRRWHTYTQQGSPLGWVPGSPFCWLPKWVYAILLPQFAFNHSSSTRKVIPKLGSIIFQPHDVFCHITWLHWPQIRPKQSLK